MDLKERIRQDTIQAMKAKDVLRLLVLRQLSSSLAAKEKDRMYEASKQGKEPEKFTDEEVMSVVSAEAKKRREASEAFTRGGRAELVEKEQKELKVLEEYLPSQMTEEEVRAEVAKAMKETGASTPQDMGMIMSRIMESVRGRADGGLVSRIVKEQLS